VFYFSNNTRTPRPMLYLRPGGPGGPSFVKGATEYTFGQLHTGCPTS